jgi:hypothetical protein
MHILLMISGDCYIKTQGRKTNGFLYIVLQQNLDIVPMLPEACSLAACLNLTAQLTCIANAIVNGDPVALQKCLTTSMTQVCYISS